MDNVIDNFSKRKDELDNYYKYLKIFDESETKVSYYSEGEHKNEQIEFDFQKVLIANAYLLLYNIVESTVSNSVNAIFQSITYSNCKYDDLTDFFKKLWVKDKIICSSINDTGQIINVFQNIINILNRDCSFDNSMNLLGISGNIDAHKIRQISNKIGLSIVSNGSELEDIKNIRNKLAHGERTFNDIGKDITVNELNSIKEKTINYLDLFVNNVRRFIENKNFKDS